MGILPRGVAYNPLLRQSGHTLLARTRPAERLARPGASSRSRRIPIPCNETPSSGIRRDSRRASRYLPECLSKLLAKRKPGNELDPLKPCHTISQRASSSKSTVKAPDMQPLSRQDRSPYRLASPQCPTSLAAREGFFSGRVISSTFNTSSIVRFMASSMTLGRTILHVLPIIFTPAGNGRCSAACWYRATGRATNNSAAGRRGCAAHVQPGDRITGPGNGNNL